MDTHDGIVSDLLIHELTHVWQFGYTVETSSLWAKHVGSYDFTPGAAWDDYSAQRQTSIVETWHKRGGKKTRSVPLCRTHYSRRRKLNLAKLTLHKVKMGNYRRGRY
jgi:hypothetical protein